MDITGSGQVGVSGALCAHLLPTRLAFAQVAPIFSSHSQFGSTLVSLLSLSTLTQAAQLPLTPFRPQRALHLRHLHPHSLQPHQLEAAGRQERLVGPLLRGGGALRCVDAHLTLCCYRIHRDSAKLTNRNHNSGWWDRFSLDRRAPPAAGFRPAKTPH